MKIRHILIAAPLLMGGCGVGLWGLSEWVLRAEQQQVEQIAAADSEALAQGKALGYDAAVAGQNAATPAQWVAVADQWQSAIDVLDSIGYNSPSHAEARAKISEYRGNKFTALQQKTRAELAMGTDLERFLEWVKESDPTGAIVAGATVDPARPNIVEVTVTTGFLAQPIAVQREAAAGLQKGWAAAHSPLKPDDAFLWLRTSSGRRFGGSRAIGGTSIYVDE